MPLPMLYPATKLGEFCVLSIFWDWRVLGPATVNRSTAPSSNHTVLWIHGAGTCLVFFRVLGVMVFVKPNE